MSRSQGQTVMSNYTTQEKFLEDKEQKQKLIQLYNDSKMIIHDSDGVIKKVFKHPTCQNKRVYKAKKRLIHEDTKFNTLPKLVGVLYRYTLNLKDVDPKRGLLANFYDKRGYNAVVRILEEQIQGAFIANLEYGVYTQLHAYILCAKQDNSFLKAEKQVNLEEYKTVIYYMSKEIVSEPNQKGKYRENYHENKEIYEACAGKVIECSNLKMRRQRQTIYRLKR